MFMRSKLLLLLLAMAGAMCAQNHTLKSLFTNTAWTDGDSFYRANLKGNFVNMSGGTLHEGGSAFGLQCTDTQDLEFRLQDGRFNPESADDGYISIPCPKGSQVEVRTFDDGNTYLLVNNSELEPIYSLRLMKPGEELRDIIISDFLRLWKGRYSVSYSALAQCPVGTTCTITPEQLDLGAYAKGRYSLMDEYESPTNIVKMADGKYLKIMLTGKSSDLRNGLSVYTVRYNKEDDVFTDEKLVLVLDRIPGKECRWSEGSTRVLLPSEITMHPRAELRLMRNEIFARHGYRFSNPDLVKYFNQELWYELDTDPDVNNKTHFSAIEAINISLIRAAESNKDLYFPELDNPVVEQTPASDSDDAPEFIATPWNKRRVMIAHFDYNELEVSRDLVTPYDLHASNVTYEWCKAVGDGFRVGLSHYRQPGQEEVKSIVICKNGTTQAYPMICIGDGEPLPEVTIHIRGHYLWFELKSASKTYYYFYNVNTHVPSHSTRNAYINRVAPNNAEHTWQQLVNEQLSPKTYNE